MLDGGVPDGIVLAGCETVSVMGQPGWLMAGALLDCAVLPSGLTSKLVGFLVEPNWLQETISRVTPPPPPPRSPVLVSCACLVQCQHCLGAA